LHISSAAHPDDAKSGLANDHPVIGLNAFAFESLPNNGLILGLTGMTLLGLSATKNLLGRHVTYGKLPPGSPDLMLWRQDDHHRPFGLDSAWKRTPSKG
jgi:hypothetical protein